MTTQVNPPEGGSDGRRSYDPGILELGVGGRRGLIVIAHAKFTVGDREDWLIGFTIWTGGEYWDTWVFVEGSYRRREITAYYQAEEWHRMGGFLFDDLPQGLAALHQPEDEEPDAFFDSVVRILNHSDFLSVSPVPDSVLTDHAAAEPYRLPERAWDELEGLPLWRPMHPASSGIGRSHLPEDETPSEVVHELAAWLSKAKQERNWATNLHEGGYIQVGLRLKCVRAEVSSGAELGGPALLTPGQLRTIKEIGWHDPHLGEDDWPNYWYEWELLDLDHVDNTLVYSVCKMVHDTLEYVFK